MPLKPTDAHAKTLILLALWDLGAAQQPVNKGLLTKRIVPKGGKIGEFQAILDEMQAEGLMEMATAKVFVPAKGVETLINGLNNLDFKFNSQIGAKTANALLKWIREGIRVSDGNHTSIVTKEVENAIASYDEFKQVALDVYDKLNRDYNLDNLVPIYRIRREIGEKVTRSNFNEWMLEMQENDIIQLMGGEIPDMTPDKREDSISVPEVGLRYYVKCLNL